MRVPWSAASIRVRMTGWYAIVLGLMLIVYAAATFVAVRQEFQEHIPFKSQRHSDQKKRESDAD